MIRRVLEFDLRGMKSLVLWALRRKDGVPAGATAISYHREQTTTIVLLLFAMVVETVGLEVILRALEVPAAIRVPILVLDLYGLLALLAVMAACVTRPHVLTGGELRLRYGPYFDLRIPRDLIASIRISQNYNEPGMIVVAGSAFGLSVGSRTNVVVELTAPITVTRPLGGLVEATTILFFADDPAQLKSPATPADSSVPAS